MNHRFIRVLAVAVLGFLVPAWFQQAAPENPPAPDIDLKVHEEILDNGMKVLIVERHDTPRVFCSLFFKVGSVNERPGLTGVSHMLEHMLFKGTKTIGTKDAVRDEKLNREIDRRMLEVREIDVKLFALQRSGASLPEDLKTKRTALIAEVDELAREQKKITIKEDMWTRYQHHGGTALNASTSFDSTQYYVELPSNKIELFFWLETDRLRDAVLREFYAERDVVKEERRMRAENSPTGLVNESFHTMYWGGHPYHWPVIGWMSDLNLMRVEDAESHYRTYYSPRNAVAVFVGDVQTDQVRAMARKYFGSLKNAAVTPAPVHIPPLAPAAQRRMASEVDAPSTLTLRFHTVPSGHPEMPPLDLLSEILNGRSGRLHRRLVEEKKVALEASASAWNQKYGGTFLLSARPREGVTLADLEQALMAELEAVQKEPVTAAELEKAKNKLLVGYVQQLRTVRSLAFMLGMTEVETSWRDVLEMPRQIQAVTAQQIQDAAKKFLKPEQSYVLQLKRREKAK